MKKLYLPIVATLISFMLSGCGGGNDGASILSTVPTTPVAITLPASNTVANLCQAPRAGNDPFNDNKPYPDRLGTLAQEKTWLHSWTDETYLWYREVPTTLNPANYATAIDYFDVLKTSATTASGKAKDQ
ncbi:MAG: peptidase S41, partial [Undibacterium sp.]|nr:peptidase S41 [Undibacterium sp.]